MGLGFFHNFSRSLGPPRQLLKPVKQTVDPECCGILLSMKRNKLLVHVISQKILQEILGREKSQQTPKIAYW